MKFLKNDGQGFAAARVKPYSYDQSEEFDLIYNEYVRKVQGTLFRISGRDNLEDLTQEVFIRIWRGLDKLKNTDFLSTWIYRITTNVAIDAVRERAQNIVRTTDKVPEMPVEENADKTLYYKLAVKEGLNLLSVDHRAVLVLHDYEDIDQDEVAEILEIPLGTVKSRLSSARRILREYFKKRGIDL